MTDFRRSWLPGALACVLAILSTAQVGPAMAATAVAPESGLPPSLAAGLTASPFAGTFSVRGTGALTFDFHASAPGAFDLRLSDLGFVSRFESLSLTFSSGGRTLTSITGDGVASIAAGAAGLYSAIVTYRTRDALLPSMFSMEVAYLPGATPVPLPGSFVLLLTALAGFAGVAGRRQRASLTLPIAADSGSGWMAAPA